MPSFGRSFWARAGGRRQADEIPTCRKKNTAKPVWCRLERPLMQETLIRTGAGDYGAGQKKILCGYTGHGGRAKCKARPCQHEGRRVGFCRSAAKKKIGTGSCVIAGRDCSRFITGNEQNIVLVLYGRRAVDSPAPGLEKKLARGRRRERRRSALVSVELDDPTG